MTSPYPLDQALVDAAYEIARRNWRRKYPVDGYVAVKVPGEPHDAYAVLSLDEKTHGVNVVRGADALESLLDAEAAPGDGFGEDSLNLLGFAMTRVLATPPEARELLRRAGRAVPLDDPIPWFLCKGAGRRGRPPNRDERRALLYILRALLRADDDGRLSPAPVKRGSVLTRLVASGDPVRPDVAYETTVVLDDADETDQDLSTDDDVVDLASLPLVDRVYGVHFVRAPSDSENDGGRAHFMFVMDMEEGLMIDAAMISGGDVDEAARRIEFTFDGEGELSVRGIPREVQFTSEFLRRAVAKRIEPLGARCVLKQSLPLIDRAFDQFIAAMSGDGPDAPVPRGPLAPDDLAGWKAADRLACEIIGREIAIGNHINRRNAKAFFGDGETADRFVDRLDDDGSLTVAFCEWYFVDRTTRTRPRSMIDLALEENPPPAIRELLEGRRAGKTSIYLVEGATPGESVDLRDVATGRRSKVTDIAMSKTAMPGFIVAAKIHAAGGFNFISVFSPSFAPMDHQEVFESLRRGGAGVGLEKLASKPHLVGRLWDLATNLARAPRPRIRLTNLDGEPHVKHEALYALDDPSSVRAAICAHDGVDGDESTDAYHWTRQEEPGRKPISNTIVARFRLIGDSLLVATNSERRHEAVHAWIEKIPGVRLVSVKTEPFDFDRERPLDDTLPDDSKGEMRLSPESAANLQAALDAYAGTWLDTKIPVLGDKTPRQSIKTAAGRAKVRLLLNSMSDPSTDGVQVRFPRERLLRELGLESEG